MIKEISSFFKKSSVLKNFISLSAAELISKIISLFTLAYLARVLSPDGFGVIGFAAAFVSYFILIVNYGFESYGTREIAKDTENQSVFVNSIISTRIIISIAAFAILAITAIFLNKDFVIQLAIIFTGINLFSTAIFMNWYFMGIQRMEFIAVRQILSSIIKLILIILFINNTGDVLLAVVITGFAELINSIWLLGIYNRSFGKFHFELNYDFIKKIMKDSTPLALSSIMVTVYYNMDMVMLGFMKADHEVGIYNAAVKIFFVGNIPYILLMKSFFPVLSKIGFTNSKKSNKVFRTYFLSMLGFGIVTSLSMYFLSNEIIVVLFGQAYTNSVIPLKILAMNSIIVCINIIFCNPLIAWGRQKEYLVVVTAGAVANVVLNIMLIPAFSYIGSALAALLSEVMVFLSVLVVYRNKLKDHKIAV